MVEGTNSDAMPLPRPVQLSDDQRKDSLPDAKVQPDTKIESRYIYYGLYTKQGALESNNPIYSDDCLISCITSKSVTPRHTAASLKKRICWVEGFKVLKQCDLYLSLSEKNPVKDDSTRIQFLGKTPGPGSSELEPIALAVDIWAAECWNYSLVW